MHEVREKSCTSRAGGEHSLSSGSPAAQRRLSEAHKFLFSVLVLQDVEMLDLAKDSAMLRQLRHCLEAELGCLMLHSWSILTATERQQDPLPGIRALEEFSTCLIYCVLVRNL